MSWNCDHFPLVIGAWKAGGLLSSYLDVFGLLFHRKKALAFVVNCQEGESTCTATALFATGRVCCSLPAVPSAVLGSPGRGRARTRAHTHLSVIILMRSHLKKGGPKSLDTITIHLSYVPI